MKDLRPLSQSPEFAECLQRSGHSHEWQGQWLMLRRRICGVPVSMMSRATLYGVSQLEELPSSPVILAPDHPCGFLHDAGALPLVSPMKVAEIDLSTPKATLRAGLHQKWRNRLNRATRAGMRIEHGPMCGRDDHWLYLADHALQKQRRYRNWPTSLTHKFTQLSTDHSRLFTAYRGTSPVAAMLFLRHGHVATYHIGHVTELGRKDCAHNLLMWRAMEWFQAQEYGRLDLGLIDTESSPSLARFKLGTGARLRPLGGTWLYLRGMAPALRGLGRWDRQLMRAE